MSYSLEKDIFTIKWVGEKTLSLPIFVALPDTGLVSLLTAINIINQSKMSLIGYIDVSWVPPIVSIIEGRPLPPVRLYANERIAILLSEVPIQSSYWRNLSKLVFKLQNDLNSTMMIGATGLPNQKRYSLEKLRIFASYTDKSLKERFLKDISDFSGLLVGPYAAILKLLLIEEKPAILLLVDSYPNYPDPEAAALVSETIGKLVGATYDVSSLLEKASQIKLMARKLAVETQKAQADLTTKTGRPAVSFYM